MKGVQIVAMSTCPGFSSIERGVGIGTSMVIHGKVVKSPAKGQLIELQATDLKVIGECDPGAFPVTKNKDALKDLAQEMIHLREIAHLRARTNTIGAVARVRNAAAYAVHSFFQEKGYYYVMTPLITTSDCEGAGEMFQVTTLLTKKDYPNEIPVDEQTKKIDYTKDFFTKPAYLTVSGQLNGEMYACALSQIYTFGPTFRAEPSKTTRHLAEFWMIEPEVAFADLSVVMDLAEEFLKYVLKHVMSVCKKDLEFFDAYVEKGLLKRLQNVLEAPFERLTYTKAIDLLLQAIKNGKKFEESVSWGMDLKSEHERYITEEIYKKPVILTDYPKEVKAFYMRLNEDGKTVAAMDVLVPKIGEIIGGSQREERLKVLEEKIATLGLNKEAYDPYLDLRRYGTVPHSGFGLGFERLLMFITGMENIKDVIPFPRFYGHADF